MSSSKDPENTFARRPTWAEIELNNLATNFNRVRQRVSPVARVMAVIKANAYGHGAVACARRLANEGADWFGVALPEEGIELRSAGIVQPVLCLAGFWPGQAAACIQHNLTPVVYRLDAIEALNQAASNAGVVADVHVKVDTGMGRLGVRFDQLSEFVNALAQFRNVRIGGIMSHLAAAADLTCALSTRAAGSVRGFYAPVVGLGSMDLSLVSVTSGTGVELDDQGTLLGWNRQQ